MKHLLKQFPITTRFALAIFLMVAALALNIVVDGPWLKANFPYLPVLLLLLVTWFLFRLDNKNLKALGMNISLGNVFYMLFGLLLGAIGFLAANYAKSLYTGESIVLSSSIDIWGIMASLYFILPTVAVEEMLFRGYLFKKTIEVSNVIVANIIFSVLFMLIHVLDGDVLQSPGMIVMLAISIPIGHLLFATALLRSRTLIFPIGIHLGNNWATRHLISSQEDGNSILVVLERTTFDTWPSFIGMLLLYNGVFVLAIFLIWKLTRSVRSDK